MRWLAGFFLTLGIVANAEAASLPTGLNEPELDRIVTVLGGGAMSRLMRTAEIYPDWPGIKLGVEIMFVPTQDISEFGNRDGSVPSLIPAPRFYLAKGLPWGLELVLQIFPAGWSHALATGGVLLKSSLQTEPKDWFALAVFGGYSRFEGFSDQLSGGGLEAGLIASKDYVRVRPFLGTSFQLLHGSFSRTVTAITDRTRWRLAPHLFAGLEVELPVNVTFQADFVSWNPSVSLLVAKKF